MKDESKATPRPWRVRMENSYPVAKLNRLCIERADQESSFAFVIAAESPLQFPDRADETRDNYELIVKAVNSYQEWQPIESAPKTGERILIGHGNSVWEDEWYDGDDANWLDCYEGGRHEGEVPTHWMALPPAPESALAAK